MFEAAFLCIYVVTTELRPAHRPVHQMVTKRNIPAVTFFLHGSLTLQMAG